MPIQVSLTCSSLPEGSYSQGAPYRGIRAPNETYVKALKMGETLHKGERALSETYGDQVREARNEPNGDLAMGAPCIGGREHEMRRRGNQEREAPNETKGDQVRKYGYKGMESTLRAP